MKDFTPLFIQKDDGGLVFWGDLWEFLVIFWIFKPLTAAWRACIISLRTSGHVIRWPKKDVVTLLMRLLVNKK